MTERSGIWTARDLFKSPSVELACEAWILVRSLGYLLRGRRRRRRRRFLALDTVRTLGGEVPRQDVCCKYIWTDNDEGFAMW